MSSRTSPIPPAEGSERCNILAVPIVARLPMDGRLGRTAPPAAVALLRARRVNARAR